MTELVLLLLIQHRLCSLDDRMRLVKKQYKVCPRKRACIQIDSTPQAFLILWTFLYSLYAVSFPISLSIIYYYFVHSRHTTDSRWLSDSGGDVKKEIWVSRFKFDLVIFTSFIVRVVPCIRMFRVNLTCWLFVLGNEPIKCIKEQFDLHLLPTTHSPVFSKYTSTHKIRHFLSF